MSTDFTTILLRDFNNLLEEGVDHNVIIQAGEEPNTKSFRAHSGILRARCPYFRTALSETWVKPQEDGVIIFKKPNISAEIFDIILKYIYTGKIALDKQDGTGILRLLMAADELILHDLFGFIQQHLIEYKAEWMQENFDLVRRTVFQNDRLKKLQDYCVERICKEPTLLFSSKDYLSVNLTVLLRVFQRDDLQLDEIEVWDYLIQWGTTQTCASTETPDLILEDISKWSKEHVKALQSTIQQCIPLIRIFQISSKDFFNKIVPYKGILPKSLYKDVMKYHMVPDCPRPPSLMPPRRGGFESILIRAKHAALISSWIDRNDINVFYNSTNIPYEYSNIPYEFKLLVRGSRDGFSPAAFHAKCDLQGPTVLVLKIHGTGQLIGGYNPISWDSTNKWGTTKDSFLFSLGDGEDLKNVVFSRVQEHSRAVLCSQAIGPCFGSGDLVMGGTHANFNLELGCSCKRQSYERHLIINHDRFSVVEYEIFKVTPKLGVRNSQVFNNNNISRTSGRFSLLLSHNHYFTPNNQQPHYN
ncbi:hypothetical protein GLOIN_2v1785846 [Rhizophagus irregularis DAOM 181602=DAOM 197198]|nr:hypothetical protein GLOIN_2v1785846 [Rhizophagus irregularis DAOM 181602=DAOM 197198]EXX54491.1 hypothetical protein RirG_234200 [Rhizophagus irregularis DAOM 197198w]POG62029.1 hypothetical protein GLOIN_2v1785846 [Rhizophagus irregularis DAOM 181602=DAOM 197198]|eukprot:XP_025168895.1 hypothetical protein GLOIN_2v1785846 [Rhizophagus irregularis DAOM 181602=DAOM 197198]